MLTRVFCTAIENKDKEISFITFGQHATVQDIMEVFDEEVGETGAKIKGMCFMEDTNKKTLNKSIKTWQSRYTE